MDLTAIRLPIPLLLAAAAAAFGYLVGRWNRSKGENSALRSQQELRRARLVARELEEIARVVRRDLSKHQDNLARFEEQVGGLSSREKKAACKSLVHEAEELLAPTLRLANQIANVYDEIRQQVNHLMSLTEVHTDPLTGVDNRRGLDDALRIQFAMMERYRAPFSVALFDVDGFEQVRAEQGQIQSDRILQRFAQLLEEQARDSDIVARYGPCRFAAIMPQTNLEGGGLFAERIRRKVAEQLPITVSGAVAEAQQGDAADPLMARAEAALAAAQSAGPNRVSCHTGEAIESPVDTDLLLVQD